MTYTDAHLHLTGIRDEYYPTRVLSLCQPPDSNLSARSQSMNAQSPTPNGYIQSLGYSQKHKLRNFNGIFSLFFELKKEHLRLSILEGTFLFFNLRRNTSIVNVQQVRKKIKNSIFIGKNYDSTENR